MKYVAKYVGESCNNFKRGNTYFFEVNKGKIRVDYRYKYKSYKNIEEFLKEWTNLIQLNN